MGKSKMDSYEALQIRMSALRKANEKAEIPVVFDLKVQGVDGIKAQFSDGSEVNLVHGRMNPRQHMAFLESRIDAL